MLGSAVSSSTPTDFQPNSHIGVLGSRPAMNRHAWKAPSRLAYAAVGMQRALDSAIGLPRRSTSAARMLGVLKPAEVRRRRIGLEALSPVTSFATASFPSPNSIWVF